MSIFVVLSLDIPVIQCTPAPHAKIANFHEHSFILYLAFHIWGDKNWLFLLQPLVRNQIFHQMYSHDYLHYNYHHSCDNNRQYNLNYVPTFPPVHIHFSLDLTKRRMVHLIIDPVHSPTLQRYVVHEDTTVKSLI